VTTAEAQEWGEPGDGTEQHVVTPWTGGPPPADLRRTRRARLAEALVEAELDALLVTDPVNIRYLSGLVSSNAAILVRADGSGVLATDARYAGAAEPLADGVELLVLRAVTTALAERAHADGLGRLGVEAHHVTLAQATSLRSAHPGIVESEGLVERLRLVKDPFELSALRHACALSAEALDDLLHGQVAGRSERELARDLEFRMLALGADGVAFPSIVAAGVHGAVPHHSPTDAVVAPGALLTIDFGAEVGGYHADCTRTVLVGGRAGRGSAGAVAWQEEVYGVVAAAQQAGLTAAVAGASAFEVDAATRRVVADAGYGDAFVHGTGHGVGLQIHEAPWLMARAVAGPTGTLTVGTCCTVEPGVYLAGRGGVRIEDTIALVAEAPAAPTVLTRLAGEDVATLRVVDP
jgi:Xaa-Pro aminopeptidase